VVLVRGQTPVYTARL